MIAANGFCKSHIRHICQIYKSEERFASVFNTFYRIPVYSAYKLKGKEETIYKMEEEGNDKEKDFQLSSWKYEPQLEQNQKEPQMRMISEMNIQQKDVRKQATENDYKDSGWDKGHLFPKSYNVSFSMSSSRRWFSNEKLHLVGACVQKKKLRGSN